MTRKRPKAAAAPRLLVANESQWTGQRGSFCIAHTNRYFLIKLGLFTTETMLYEHRSIFFVSLSQRGQPLSSQLEESLLE